MEQYREINKTLSETKERTARLVTKVEGLVKDNKKLESVKYIAVKGKDGVTFAHKRVDNIDKQMFSIGSILILGIISAVLGFIIVS